MSRLVTWQARKNNDRESLKLLTDAFKRGEALAGKNVEVAGHVLDPKLNGKSGYVVSIDPDSGLRTILSHGGVTGHACARQLLPSLLN